MKRGGDANSRTLELRSCRRRCYYYRSTCREIRFPRKEIGRVIALYLSSPLRRLVFTTLITECTSVFSRYHVRCAMMPLLEKVHVYSEKRRTRKDNTMLLILKKNRERERDMQIASFHENSGRVIASLSAESAMTMTVISPAAGAIIASRRRS